MPPCQWGVIFSCMRVRPYGTTWIRSRGGGTSSSTMRPACETRHWLSRGPVQKLLSRVRRRLRPKLMPQVWLLPAAVLFDYKSRLKSADHPRTPRRPAVCHGTYHFGYTRRTFPPITSYAYI